MAYYKYDVLYSNKFRNSLKNVSKQGKDIKKLLDIVDKLAYKEKLELKYRNHKLRKNKKFKNCFECHIEPDWLLVYQYQDDKLILLLVDTGSHSKLF